MKRQDLGIYKWIFFVCLMLWLGMILSACGFHLRGSQGSYDLSFKTLALVFPDNCQLGQDVYQTLNALGKVKLVSEPSQAEVTLEELSENKDRSVLSVNSQGRVRQYSLTYTVIFRVTNEKGRELLPPTTLSTVRQLDYNESQTLANSNEEQLLYRDMGNDLVQQMIRRLAGIKRPASKVGNETAP